MHGEERQRQGRHRRRRERQRRMANQKPLSECCADTTHVILENPDKQSMEMGLFGGAIIEVMRNSSSSPNMVVGVNDSRYMISKETARKIIVG